MSWCRLCGGIPVTEAKSIEKVELQSIPSVLSFGEVLWDLLPSGAVLGGAPFNLASRLNSLGVPTRMASRVGMDELGDSALSAARAQGLDTRLIQRDPEHPTGRVEVSLGPGGEPDFTILPDMAYDCIEFTPDLEQAAREAGCVCFGSLAQRSARSRQTLHQILDSATQALRMLDVNLRRGCYSTETVRASLQRADILKLNESEVEAVTSMLGWPALNVPEFCLRAVTECGLRLCVVTLGGEGSLGCTQAGETVYSPGWRVKVVDTVGSGDAFSAGFLKAYFQGLGLKHCCERGNLLGALNAARAGATARITDGDIRELEASGTDRLVRTEFAGLI